MLVIGALGFAKQLLPALIENHFTKLAFYDDYNPDVLNTYEYPVLKNIEQARAWFAEHGNDFCLGISNPALRYRMAQKFAAIGGQLRTVISSSGTILATHSSISNGCTILAHTIIENDVAVGEGTLINIKAAVCHDSTVGRYCEIAPGALMLGRTTLGDFSFIGANAVINPKVKVGSNVIVGSGAVVHRDVPDNCVVAGVPAKKIRDLQPLSID